jgi:hypothetical protein
VKTISFCATIPTTHHRRFPNFVPNSIPIQCASTQLASSQQLVQISATLLVGVSSRQDPQNPLKQQFQDCSNNSQISPECPSIAHHFLYTR